MAPIYTPVSGKIKLKLKVCVVHLWTILDFNLPNEEFFLHMLLIDEKVMTFYKHFLCLLWKLCKIGIKFNYMISLPLNRTWRYRQQPKRVWFLLLRQKSPRELRMSWRTFWSPIMIPNTRPPAINISWIYFLILPGKCWMRMLSLLTILTLLTSKIFWLLKRKAVRW